MHIFKKKVLLQHVKSFYKWQCLGHFYSFAYIVTQIWNEDEVTKSKYFHPDTDRFKAAHLIWLFTLGLDYPMQMKDK